MKPFPFKIDGDSISLMAERFRQLGIGARTLAMVLIAATALYAAVDLTQKIASLKAPIAKVEKAATSKRPASTLPQINKTPEAYRVIASRNLFGSTDKESAWSGGAPGAAAPVDQMEKTALQLDLLGTIAGGGAHSRAVIDDKASKKPRVFKIGDQVGNATIVRILRNSVVLRVEGREEVLFMKVHQPGRADSAKPASGGALPKPPEPGRPVVPLPSAAVQDSNEIKQILSMAQARPHFEGGKMDGFYLGRIEEGSLLKRLGLQTGDIVEGINNLDFQKPQDVTLLQSIKLAPGNKNALKVKRDGKQLTVNLD
jgi:type II secretion system protein C